VLPQKGNVRITDRAMAFQPPELLDAGCRI
jgi:hypothetical protein